MRKLFTITLGLFCAVLFMGCSIKTNNADDKTTTVSQETKETGKSEETGEPAPITGGWAINEAMDPANNKEAIEAFNKAIDCLDGYRYEVVAVLGSQVVSGMNYSYLCKGEMVIPDAKPDYNIVNVYEDLKGDAQITETVRIPEGKPDWEYNSKNTSLKENPDVDIIFNKALEEYVGVVYDPIAYIGKKNNTYAIIAKTTTVTVNPQTNISIVYITGTDSSARIDDIKEIDIALE